MERAFELGIQVPKTFEEWSDFFPRYTVLPWLTGKKHQRLQTMREYLRMAFNRVPVSIHRKDRFTRMAHELLAIPSRWRLDHDVYGFPVEIWANEEKRLVTWLTRRLGFQVHAPDLNGVGYALVGGRLVAGNEKPG
jgi:hypothetical protein